MIDCTVLLQLHELSNKPWSRVRLLDMYGWVNLPLVLVMAHDEGGGQVDLHTTKTSKHRLRHGPAFFPSRQCL